MPTVTVPDLTNKELWFTLRALFWTAVGAYVVLVWTGVLVPPEPVAGFMGLITFIAVWVALYNLYLALKGKKA